MLTGQGLQAYLTIFSDVFGLFEPKKPENTPQARSLVPENMGKTAAYFQQLRVLFEADALSPAVITLHRRNGADIDNS